MLDIKKDSAGRKKRNNVLSAKLEDRLANYAAAALAAGVSMLALGSPAQAEIVYTPAHVVIPENGDFVAIDLNHDGIADFSLWIRSYADFSPTYVHLFLYGVNPANGVEEQDSDFAARLTAGATIGPEEKFAAVHTTFGIPLMQFRAAYTSAGGKDSSCTGAWAKPARSGYLGLVFDISGKKHFGWARLAAGCKVDGNAVTAILTGYAYNTVPDQSILAGQREDGADAAGMIPEPATLGRLALGAAALDTTASGTDASDKTFSLTP